jgi:hypothetical protein
LKALRQVHLRTAGDRQHRPDEAEDDEEHQRHDVVRHRVQPHGENAHELQPAAVLMVAGKAAEQAAEREAQERRGHEQADGPGQGAGNQARHRRRESRERGPEIGRHDATPERQVLLERRAGQAVELAQRLPHRLDRLRGGAAERGRDRDRLLDRIDRRRMGDGIGEIDADEGDEQELPEPLRDIRQIGVHGGTGAPLRAGAPARCRTQLFGLSFTNM